MMSYTFCTYLDHRYLAKGLCLYRSLERWVRHYQLHVLAMDGIVAEAMSLPNVIVHPMSKLIRVYPQWEQYRRDDATWDKKVFWKLAPPLMDWVFRHSSQRAIAYMDADTWFRGDPSYLYNEVGLERCAITPHRWTPAHAERLKVNGFFNVGWVYMTRAAEPILKNWMAQVNEWAELVSMGPGLYADQGYLDEWPEKYGAYAVRSLGANLAPWNQEQYQYRWTDDNRLLISEDRNPDSWEPLVFYHFHEYRQRGPKYRTAYSIHPELLRLYDEYDQEYANVCRSYRLTEV